MLLRAFESLWQELCRERDSCRLEQIVYFLKRRQCGSRADGATLESGDRVRESQGLFHRESSKQTINEAAVKSIAGTGRVFAVNRESRRMDEPFLKVCQHTILPQRSGDE